MYIPRCWNKTELKRKIKSFLLNYCHKCDLLHITFATVSACFGAFLARSAIKYKLAYCDGIWNFRKKTSDSYTLECVGLLFFVGSS